MKIVFVSSGNRLKAINPIIKAQAKSLTDQGHNVDFFLIYGRGARGYLSNIIRLRRFLKKKNYEIVHAHFSYSAMAASLAGAKNLVVSLMGSDVNAKKYSKYILRAYTFFFCKAVIVKSEEMRNRLGLKNAHIIPNGVDTHIFHPIERKEAIKKLGWNSEFKNILFAANPKRTEKNYRLAEKAIQQISSQEKIKIYSLGSIPHMEIPVYMNAANVVILTSKWEGSPNVIKEAMACNCVIVSTHVGDVKWLFSGTFGCYISDNSADDVAEKMVEAIKFSEGNYSNGRERIIDLKLDAENVAKSILKLYSSILK